MRHIHTGRQRRERRRQRSRWQYVHTVQLIHTVAGNVFHSLTMEDFLGKRTNALHQLAHSLVPTPRSFFYVRPLLPLLHLLSDFPLSKVSRIFDHILSLQISLSSQLSFHKYPPLPSIPLTSPFLILRTLSTLYQQGEKRESFKSSLKFVLDYENFKKFQVSSELYSVRLKLKKNPQEQPVKTVRSNYVDEKKLFDQSPFHYYSGTKHTYLFLQNKTGQTSRKKIVFTLSANERSAVREKNQQRSRL